ncbi:hypothetical protein UPYG_G00105060 [Umbra pygmaea]|uniref:Uncharacterized protein n=1 Tax=Umbra pygmaea TaxID=75934 RepID=A0ABD0XRD2_UMBPY
MSGGYTYAFNSSGLSDILVYQGNSAGVLLASGGFNKTKDFSENEVMGMTDSDITMYNCQNLTMELFYNVYTAIPESENTKGHQTIKEFCLKYVVTGTHGDIGVENVNHGETYSSSHIAGVIIGVIFAVFVFIAIVIVLYKKRIQPSTGTTGQNDIENDAEIQNRPQTNGYVLSDRIQGEDAVPGGNIEGVDIDSGQETNAQTTQMNGLHVSSVNSNTEGLTPGEQSPEPSEMNGQGPPMFSETAEETTVLLDNDQATGRLMLQLNLIDKGPNDLE